MQAGGPPQGLADRASEMNEQPAHALLQYMARHTRDMHQFLGYEYPVNERRFRERVLAQEMIGAYRRKIRDMPFETRNERTVEEAFEEAFQAFVRQNNEIEHGFLKRKVEAEVAEDHQQRVLLARDEGEIDGLAKAMKADRRVDHHAANGFPPPPLAAVGFSPDARLMEQPAPACESARDPDADRRRKPLKLRLPAGSLSDADPQA